MGVAILIVNLQLTQSFHENFSVFSKQGFQNALDGITVGCQESEKSKSKMKFKNKKTNIKCHFRCYKLYHYYHVNSSIITKKLNKDWKATNSQNCFNRILRNCVQKIECQNKLSVNNIESWRAEWSFVV